MMAYSFVTVAVATACLHIIGASSTSLPGTTVLFENDGNWTAHASRPSALFVNMPTDEVTAANACAAYGETLLSCKVFAQFQNSFSYQQYLGSISSEQLFWSSCSENNPATSRGSVVDSTSETTFPFLCTNSAPLVDKVDPDYSVFPRVNAYHNGTTYEGMRDHMTFRFAGIPFAEPPTGNLRFKPAKALNSTPYVNATKYSPACLQYGYFDGNDYGLSESPHPCQLMASGTRVLIFSLVDPWGNSEDCLYLNIYTPFLPSNTSTSERPGKPVMVWYYGGGDTQGSAADSTFDGASLTSRADVVVVTINVGLIPLS